MTMGAPVLTLETAMHPWPPETLARAILDLGRQHTPWSGAIRMPDGQDYYGTVWKLSEGGYGPEGTWRPGFYIFYQNKPFRVIWKDGKYVVTL